MKTKKLTADDYDWSPRKIIKAANRIGQRFGNLTILDVFGSDEFVCRCDCGNLKTVRRNSVLIGKTKSCGCLQNINGITVFKKTHGETHRNQTAEYRTWQAMKARCYNPKQKAYKYYGGRGITVCGRWLNSYENFILDMGRKPNRKRSIDRINNDGNYEPSNCRWATNKQQQLNKRPRTKKGVKND